MESLNLCDYPWIPVAGEKDRKSLIQIFSDSSLRRLSGNPVDKIVILRLLLCIVQASSKLPDNDAWLKLTDETLAQNALAYLKKHHDCFELYGEHPFLQFPKLAEAGGRVDSTKDLLVNFADNKVILLHWDQLLPLSSAEKIILLLRSACYTTSKKNKFDTGTTLTEGVEKNATGHPGTLLGSKGYLHAYMLGEKILGTLRLNLLTEEDIQNIGAYQNGLGSPFWEKMPRDENDTEYRKTYFGQLFPIDKFLMLKGDGIIKIDGLIYPEDKEGLRDPALTITHQKGKIEAVLARPSERPWRQLPALLSFLRSKQYGGSPYFLSMGSAKLNLSSQKTKYLGFWVGGIEVSSQCGGQSVKKQNDYVESEFYVNEKDFSHDNFPVYEQLMQDLNDHANCLGKCVSSYYKAMKNAVEKQLATKAKSIFWNVMEPRAQEIILLAFSDQNEEKIKKIKEEKKIWFRTLCDIYDEVCPHETPRQISYWVEASPRFQKIQKAKGKK